MLDLIKNLESSEEFKKWKNKHKKAFFSSAFIILDENKKGDWQFDYYDPKSKKIYSFLICEKLQIQESDKIFKKKETKIKEFKLENLKINFDKALKIIDNIKKENFPDETVNKTIAILQHLKKPLWNITLLTTSFNLINIKISSKTGKVLSKKEESVLKFRSGQS